MNSITDNMGAIVLVLVGLCLVLMLVLQAMQISRLRQRLDLLTRGSDGDSLEAVFDAHLETVHQVGRDLDELTARTAVLESSARHHFARLGLVRFNPFPDTGGNQSFALALLDESEEGFVVSSLHSRTGTRIYAKAIVGGKADTSLSTEETEAMGLARTRKTVRPAQVVTRGTGAKGSSLPAEATPSGSSAGASVAKAAAAASPKAAPAAAKVAAPAKAMTAAKATTPASAVAAAPAKVPAPARAASAGGASDRKVAGGSETTDRTLAAKGQSKSKEDGAADSSSAEDADRIGRKPGRPVVAEPVPGQSTDTPGS
ncbi:MAG TPA: DUF4446 family protein [Candidatus Limnocylindrales bacterium]